MVISPFSIYNYLLSIPKENSNLILKSLKSDLDSLKFVEIFKDNPKNNFIRVYNEEGLNYIFKQSKINIPNQNWKIVIEAEFYKSFNLKKFVISDFHFDQNSKVLILPIKNKKQFEINKVAEILKCFHCEMSLKNNDVKKFRKNVLFNNGTPYTRFVDILKLTKRNKNVLNEILFPQKSSGKESIREKKVTDFLSKSDFFDFVIDFNNRIHKTKTHIIHGDFRTENLIFTDTEGCKIIDFEFVCEGDPMWDIANIFESLFTENYFTSNKIEIFETKFQYIISFLNTYWGKTPLQNLKSEILKIIDFWILGRIMNLIKINFDFLDNEMKTLTLLISERISFRDQILNTKLTNKELLLNKNCNYDLFEE